MNDDGFGVTDASLADLPTYRMSLDDPGPEAFLDEIARTAGGSWIVRWLTGYLVVSHEDVVALLRDRRLDQAAGKVPALIRGETDPVSTLPADDLLIAEGDKHTRLRRLVGPAFSTKSIDTLRPGMRAYLEPLIGSASAAVAEGGQAHVDIVELMSAYPVATICQLLGVGEEMWEDFSRWAESHFLILKSSEEGDDERDRRIANDAAELESFCIELIEERRAALRGDLLSALILENQDGDRLSTDELVSLIRSMIAAGIDTTRNQIGSLMALLVDDPSIWERLRVDRGLVSTVVEESLRLLNPIRIAMRTVGEPLEHRGLRFETGDLLALHLSAAGRDPDVFDSPDRLDPARVNARSHVAFSNGVHHCLGAALARAELQEMLSVMLDHWSGIAADGPVVWKHARLPVWGAERLPIAVTSV